MKQSAQLHTPHPVLLSYSAVIYCLFAFYCQLDLQSRITALFYRRGQGGPGRGQGHTRGP